LLAEVPVVKHQLMVEMEVPGTLVEVEVPNQLLEEQEV
jgi:hypothetical protein